MRITTISAFMAITTLLFCVAGAQTTAPTLPKVGEQAKDFSLKTLSNEKVALSELVERGPVVLVVLRGWPGYQCPICTRQVGELLQNAEAFAAADVTVVLVYPGPADDLGEHAKEFIKGRDFPEHFRFVIDPAYAFTNAWGLRWDEAGETAYPSSFVIGQDRIIRYAKVSRTHGGRAPTTELLDALKKIPAAD